MTRWRLPALAGALLISALAQPAPAAAFCGFYVAKADTKLFNSASKVVIAREKRQTVITMVNDYEGDLTEFAMVVPVPHVLKQDQIRVRDQAVVDHLDAYTAPRLVEYRDRDPCKPVEILARAMRGAAPRSANPDLAGARAKALGVTIEAEYTIGEYDILILSAKESSGLETWLTGNGYRMPEGAGRALEGYIAMGVKFFVAKINLAEKAKIAGTYLRPLQIAFSSDMFMLPIKLGMVNAKGPQELFIFMLTKKGRVEAVNYPTVRVPSNVDVPTYVKTEFASFYASLFREAVRRESGRALFLEYAWDMGWCDPCAADPLSPGELEALGVTWLGDAGEPGRRGGSRNVFVTRLHLRYDAESFHEDLMFRETDDRQNFQGRYVMRHPWTGPAACPAGEAYKRGLPGRFAAEAQTLARLTGWKIADIHAKMAKSGQAIAK